VLSLDLAVGAKSGGFVPAGLLDTILTSKAVALLVKIEETAKVV